MVTYTNILPKMVNPRDIAGNAEDEEEWKKVDHADSGLQYKESLAISARELVMLLLCCSAEKVLFLMEEKRSC